MDLRFPHPSSEKMWQGLSQATRQSLPRDITNKGATHNTVVKNRMGRRDAVKGISVWREESKLFPPRAETCSPTR